ARRDDGGRAGPAARADRRRELTVYSGRWWNRGSPYHRPAQNAAIAAAAGIAAARLITTLTMTKTAPVIATRTQTSPTRASQAAIRTSSPLRLRWKTARW